METHHPAFDASEQDILSQIVPEGAPDSGDAADIADPAGAPAAEAAPVIVAAPAPVAPGVAVPAAPVAGDVTDVVDKTAAAPAPAVPEAPKPQGDMRAALRASRRSEAKARDELTRLREENEQLRKTAPPPASHVSDEELAELEANYPAMGKVVRTQRELVESIRRQAPAPAPAAEFDAPRYDPAVQEQIDLVPDLLAWQYDPAQQDKFHRAIQYDLALAADPDWQARSVTDRFEEAARRTRAAFGVGTPSPALTPSAAPAAPRPDPAAVIAAAPTEGPKGISDFRGGGPASAPAYDYSRMSDEQIIASLPQL